MMVTAQQCKQLNFRVYFISRFCALALIGVDIYSRIGRWKNPGASIMKSGKLTDHICFVYRAYSFRRNPRKTMC